MDYIEKQTEQFKEYLKREEKSSATVEKYLRDVRVFLRFSGGILSKEMVIRYKEKLKERYAPASVNSMLTALNTFLRFIGREDCNVRLLRIQRQIFLAEKKELSTAEYHQLLTMAKNSRIAYVIQTLCGLGIRVSELRFITVEAVRQGWAEISCKNKTRIVLLSPPVQKLLKKYIKKSGVIAGSVFVTKGKKPLDRSNIWKEMKALCKKTSVSPRKVFPHNLRHLFARTFYRIEKDVVRLADLLGHSSINTTRIYTMDCLSNRLPAMKKMGQLLLIT